MLKGLIFILCLFVRSITSETNPLDISCEQLCKRIICEDVDCGDSKKVDHGSLCGCCPVCVDYIVEKEICGLDPGPRGGVPKSECAPGLECLHGVCSVPDDASDCWKLRRWRESLMIADYYEPELSPDAWLPSCDKQYYKTKQCKQHKCFCFGKNGERLFGQANRQLAKNMTCGCSLALFEREQHSGLAWNTEPHEHCTLDGNYEELQCVGNVCYCSDPITGRHIGQVTLIEYVTLLPCFDEKRHSKHYLTKCENIIQRILLITYQFALKGVELIGLKDINCDYDGSFSKTQCLTDKCFCTDRNGKSFKSYSSEKAHTEISPMLCNCARDEYDTEFMNAHYSRLECESNTGNYKHHQTVEHNSFCVDEDGEILDYVDDIEDLARVCYNKQKMASKIDDSDGGDYYYYM